MHQNVEVHNYPSLNPAIFCFSRKI